MEVGDAAQILINTDLLDKAERILERRVEQNPQDIDALQRLGEVARQKGELSRASELYERLAQCAPKHPSAQFLSRCLVGKLDAHHTPKGTVWPAPFVLLESFLPEETNRRLLQIACANQTKFEPATVGGTSYSPELRQQINLDNEEIKDLMKPAVVPALLQAWPKLVQNSPSSNPAYRGLTVTLTHNQQFGRIHRDDVGGKYSVSCVYYFHQEPRAFTGGALLLYDTQQDGLEVQTRLFTQVKPNNNSVIFYPSHVYHQITSVSCEQNDFAKGRFAIASHWSI